MVSNPVIKGFYIRDRTFMREKTLKEAQPGYPGVRDSSQRNPLAPRRWPVGVMVCTLAFVVCILLTVSPLVRMPDSLIRLHIFLGSLLGLVSLWLPANLGGTYQPSSASIELFCLITLAFLCYSLGALFVWRYEEEKRIQSTIRGCIWSGAMLAGAIYIVTPAMLSHDITVYAGYSRLLAIYHANPYFVPMSSFPRDPLTRFDDWAPVVSAYGPIWMLVCGFWGWLLNPDPSTYVVAFRFFALAMHLLNTWLVGRTLQTMGRSPRTVTLGMLLYAWNPLVLLESSLGGHNDVFMITFVLAGIMITFVLAGILLAAHAEQRDQLLHTSGYLLPAVAFTLAVLVKFTAIPILAAYLLLLACKALRSTVDSPHGLKQALISAWKPAVLVLFCSGLVVIFVTLAFYGPFWVGHRLNEIVASFKKPPSAIFAENSFMRSIINWLNFHPAQKHNALLVFLSQRRFWDSLNLMAIMLCLMLGARQLWLKPAIRTFVTVALATMCVVLLITPWFFPWYITWIVGLAVLCLPLRQNRTTWALLALTLTFSFSALSLYLFNAGLLGSHGYLVSLFDTIPPLCAFLVLWYCDQRWHLIIGHSEGR